MRTTFLLLAGVCVLTSTAVQAQATAKPQTPPATSAAAPKPAVERKEIKLAAKALQAFVGEYEMAPERTLTITLEDGYLWGQPTGQSKRQLFPESQTKFFLKDIDAQVTFKKDAKGTVTGALMEQADRPAREMKKIK